MDAGALSNMQLDTDHNPVLSYPIISLIVNILNWKKRVNE